MEKFSLKNEQNQNPENNLSPQRRIKKMSRREFLKKAAIGAAGALAFGAPTIIEKCDIGGLSEEKKRKLKERREQKERDAEIADKMRENPYYGYPDLDHFLDAHPEIKDGSDEFKKAENYFNRDKSN